MSTVIRQESLKMMGDIPKSVLKRDNLQSIRSDKRYNLYNYYINIQYPKLGVLNIYIITKFGVCT